MSLIPPIYDRTELDIQLQTGKAFFNVQDYQRIESNLQTLADAFGITIAGSNWAVEDFPTPQRMGAMLANLQAVRDAYYDTPNTPATPELPINHYQQVNDIEQAIWLLWYVWAANTKEKQYCGELYAGEEIGVL